MMSSSPETTTRTTGAHRAQRESREAREARREAREARDRAAARTLAQRTPARYEPYLDGLFTYCLSVLCDHDTATAALGDVLALAERRGHRVPEAAGDRRAWLYALARWACLRKLAEAKQKRQATHAAGRTGAARGAGKQAPEPPVAAEVRVRRRRELALLAWPEAAGTTPEQREALELAVRHHLAAHEVARVLGMEPAAARELLATAACEVERTRAALAVVETGGCPSVAHLTGDSQMVLSAAVRGELVRHVDECPRCRRTAECAVPGRWPGATVTPAELPVLEAPRAALHMTLAHHPRTRGAAVPRFDRRGFPMDPKDRAARRDRLRARAVTTTVVATVVAAPVLALWAAYRGGPAVDDDGRSATAREAQGPDAFGSDAAGGYENAGNASVKPGARVAKDGKADVSVEVVSVGGADREGAGKLAVGAANDGDTTLITLTASGSADVDWSVSTSAGWLYFSQSSGTLAPGETLTIKVYVDHLREPSGHWHAQVAVAPAGAVVTIDGYGTAPSRPTPRPSSTPPSVPPSTPPTDPTTPAPPPTDPTPTPTTPPPSDTPTPTPTPTDSGTPSPSGS
ncbi:BACON domain-containing protein [Streptomyces actinomycinicus]|uniref:BACON domain-containing protein n=1 Tax=Streptomyces actinomycinicus TaxID=1695166 RepID=A0A937JQN2_9ACTN|nr:BACON domain-containing protein [Streptomyces actinomycinicus]MBL1085586.1 BACON domain-containing protein [Streptomyces actinomycinicus]